MSKDEVIITVNEDAPLAKYDAYVPTESRQLDLPFGG